MKSLRSVFILFLGLVSCHCQKNDNATNENPPVANQELEARYFAHAPVEDPQGVIAPWYTGQNGQLDQRVKITIDTLKRYPWALESSPAVPYYIPNGHASVSIDGKITVGEETNPGNGDLVTRGYWALASWMEYYSYSGDLFALAHAQMIVDHLLKNCLTPESHSWPGMVISIPFGGIPYGKCSVKGQIQLDAAGMTGYWFLKYYQMKPQAELLTLLKNWGELFAKNVNKNLKEAPWGRFADPDKDPFWKEPRSNKLTGSLSFILFFLDELIETTNPPANSNLRKALRRGENYLRDVLLPQWHVIDTWGRSYFDVLGDWHQTMVADQTANYILKNKERFPLWKIDVRRLLDMNIARTSGHPDSKSGMYSGAWVYPESNFCCGASMGYAPMLTIWGTQELGFLLKDTALLERARRIALITTYDATNTGYAEDLLFGGQDVYKHWIKIAYGVQTHFYLKSMIYQPELAPHGEDHLLSSQSTVQKISYEPRLIQYSTFSAPRNNIDILKLSFLPISITANGSGLELRTNLSGNGYTVQDLKNGDYVVRLRHDGSRNIRIEGPALSTVTNLEYELTEKKFIPFYGNQIYLEGKVGPDGGQAQVKIDGQELAVKIDFWNQEEKTGLVFRATGLSNNPHMLEINPITSENPRTQGNKMYLKKVWWVDRATPAAELINPPMKAQRVMMGYVGRKNKVDRSGNEWTTGLELTYDFGIKPEVGTDLMLPSFWTKALSCKGDECLFAYGVHAPQFNYGFTVLPGQYHLKLHFHCGRKDILKSPMKITINKNPEFEAFDLNSSCQKNNQVITLEKTSIEPSHGAVQVQFSGTNSSEAYVSALELIPL